MSSTPTPDDALAAIASTQFGCFTSDQIAAAGITAGVRSARVRRGLWLPVLPGVYIAGTTARTRAVTAVAARLRVGPDTMFSQLTAARLLGIDVRHDNDDVWLRAPMTAGIRSWPGVRVTRSRRPVTPVIAHGQPVVPAARTIVDLAGMVTEEGLAGMLYDALRQRQVRAEDVAGELDAIGAGLPGLGRLRRVLSRFDPDYEAMVEGVAAEALSGAGIIMTPQHEVWDGPFLAGRLDFADEALRHGVEIDGYRYHGSRDAQAKDRRRDRRMSLLGWTISRYDATEVLADRNRFAADVAAIRASLVSRRQYAG